MISGRENQATTIGKIVLDRDDHIFRDVEIPAALDAEANGGGGFADESAVEVNEHVCDHYLQDYRFIYPRFIHGLHLESPGGFGGRRTASIAVPKINNARKYSQNGTYAIKNNGWVVARLFDIEQSRR
jgi:hypothetical protein